MIERVLADGISVSNHIHTPFTGVHGENYFCVSFVVVCFFYENNICQESI